MNHLDDVTGTLEPGKLADLVILDRDVFAPDAGPIGDTRVLLTMVEGQVVHEDPELERRDASATRESAAAVDR